MIITALIGVLSTLAWSSLAYATRRREVLMGADEGYLWYGTQRVRAGEQPIRDFRSYEPGRYWCCAALARVRGTGLVTVRAANHVAAAVALTVLTVVLARVDAPVPALVVLPGVVLAWSRTHYKLVEAAALALVAAGGAAALGGLPGGHLALGVSIGLAGLIGLNLAAYATGAAGVLVLVGMLAGSASPVDIALVGAGGLIGAAPLLLWWAIVPGTFAATWRARVTVPRTRGTTNLPLPLPWPWRPDVPVRGAPTPAARWATRLGLSVVPLAGLGAAAVALRLGGDTPTRVLPLIAVGLMAMHTAYSRADLSHVGRPVPLLLGGACLLPGPIGWLAVAMTIVITVPIVTATHPRLARRRRPQAYARRDVGGDLVWLLRADAAQLDLLAEHVADGTAVAAVPLGVHLLAALDCRSAVVDTYCVYPATRTEDEVMRDELAAQRPVVVLVNDRALDDDPGLSFSSTHPITWAWLTTHGDLLADGSHQRSPLPATVSLWRVAAH